MTARKGNPGFSLVLSLTVMSAIVLLMLSLATFIAIETRASSHAQVRLMANLNALAAMRLALAHLQQEAGPDRRATARADFTVTQTQAGRNWSTARNMMWTGVWRNDFPDVPPAWLVSGRHDRPAGTQSASLHSTFLPHVPAGGSNVKPDYPEGVWLPWQTDYAPPSETLIPLVGDATAAGPVDAHPSIVAAQADRIGRPDGRVSLPKVPFPEGRASYAYWIGDEGVKVRLSLSDHRVSGATADDETRRGAVRAPGRFGLQLIPSLSALDPDVVDPRIASQEDFSLGPPAGLTPAASHALAKENWPLISYASRSVLADSHWGGLKVDLSSVFELSDAQFRATEYGAGAGHGTYVWNPHDHRTGAGTPSLTTPVWADSRNLLRYIEPGWSVDHYLAPTYTVSDITRPGSRIRGPLWEAIRAHHLLYREVEITAAGPPTLRARAHFPNTRNLAGQVNSSTAHYSHLYNRMDTTEDPWAFDSIRSTPAPKPTKPGVSPYVARQLLAFGLQEDAPTGGLRLVLSPVTVLHNPYNVALRLQPQTPGDAGMRLSFRWWDAWRLDQSSTAGGGTTWSTDLLTMAMRTGGNPNRSESMRVYIPPVTLEPGEFKAFSLPGPEPAAFDRIGTAVDRFDFLGGFWVNCLTPGGAPLRRNATDTLSVQLRSSGPFYVRHMISCWPGDRLNEAGNSSDAALFNASSEVTELLSNSIDPGRSGFARAIHIPPSAVLPVAGQPPQPFAALDYGVRWADDPLPFPVFTRSNPTAPMTRPEATGWGPSAMPAGYATTSSSFKMVVRAVNDWTEVIETDLTGRRGFGGSSASSAGMTHAVYAEVPLRPPLSLAEYAHANVHLRDQDPLLAAGNSFASPFMERHRVWLYRSDQNNTDVDRSYLLNAALFDRHFLSGAGPVWSGGSQVTPMTTVLDDFAAGRRPLANPRISLLDGPNSANTRRALGSHRTFASAVLLDGGFNVNNVSVDAWAALLGSTKGLPSGDSGPNSPARDANARFPRAVRDAGAEAQNRKPFSSDEAWGGLTSLDDRQIRILAKSIVDEIRWRCMYPHRTEEGNNFVAPFHDTPKAFRGATATSKVQVPLPFQGMAQFVNRFTCNTYPFIGNGGCLQNAIYRADALGAELTTRNGMTPRPSNDYEQLPNQGPGQVPWTRVRINLRAGHAAGPANGSSQMTEGAPGSLLQSDILAAVGSAMVARSDTFVIRVYADAQKGRDVARVWMEALVQRTPEFIQPDAGQSPELLLTSTTNSKLANPVLKPANRLLGRRFKIVRARTLRPEQL